MDKKTILVIDDTPSNLVLLNNLLSKHYTVKVANSGSKGIRLAMADQAPDLILLDVVMPELNGFEVCDVLKKNRKTHHIPTMFLTTLHEDAEVQLGLALGAEDFISKPVGASELTRKIANHFAHVEAHTVPL
ncbi:MAG: response regulator [Rhodoferax sp.]|nr:response regulator [Rhodoferax sp.]